MKRVFAFDFDGVLVQNHNELPYFAIYAWKKLFGKRPNVPSDKIIKCRPYAKNAAEIYGLLVLLEKGRKITKNGVKDVVMSNKEVSEKFAKNFYHERQSMQKKNPKKWVKLYNRIDFAADFFNRVSRTEKVYIVSSKDKPTILRLVKHFGINITSQKILAKEISFDKRTHMGMICKKEGVDYKDILFIDDAIDHVIPLKSKGVNAFLASWGYATKEDIKEAKRLGISILDKNNISSLLTTDNMEEYFWHVDEKNKPIGKIKRKEAHSTGAWHRSIGILIMNRKGEVLLQKRSMTKDLYKGYWADSVGGHVDYGETYEAAAKREMKEEIGVSTKLTKLFDAKKYTGNDNEFMRVFMGVHNGPFSINRHEADYVKFSSLKNINRILKQGKFSPAAEMIFQELNRNPGVLRKLGMK